MFVYGSARVGEYNHWFQGAVVDEIRNVTTQGRLTHNRSYPYLITTADSYVVGDLVLVDRYHPDFLEFVMMELGAGYEAEDITVHPTRLGSEVGAIAFTIPADHQYASLPSVPDGDWVRFYRTRLRHRAHLQ